MGKVLGDTTGMTVTLMAYLGDRLGIFKELAANGPATSDQLAGRAGINERYAREWLNAMACAGYLEYDADSVSVLYCMSTSLAANGEGLGTCGLPPSKVRELCEEAGFSSVRQLPLENPFNILYEIKP